MSCIPFPTPVGRTEIVQEHWNNIQVLFRCAIIKYNDRLTNLTPYKGNALPLVNWSLLRYTQLLVILDAGTTSHPYDPPYTVGTCRWCEACLDLKTQVNEVGYAGLGAVLANMPSLEEVQWLRLHSNGQAPNECLRALRNKIKRRIKNIMLDLNVSQSFDRGVTRGNSKNFVHSISGLVGLESLMLKNVEDTILVQTVGQYLHSSPGKLVQNVRIELKTDTAQSPSLLNELLLPRIDDNFGTIHKLRLQSLHLTFWNKSG
ncbi:hypothetical protein BDZ91DRAFT_110972 [Kalaharituber pfeilii]|nr:hypothetical protein BDZ91DRAFT_110972 [Kalaharituber pfeilii]